MIPDLFTIGPLTLHTYGLLVALGITAAMLTAIKSAKSAGITSQQVMDMGFTMILSGLIGSRLMYIIMNFAHYRQYPADILKIWQGGLVFSGGVIAVLITLGWYLKRRRLPFWSTADLWAPAVSLGQAVGRIGCFMAGCCYGLPTDLQWGVIFTHPHSLAPLNISIHPTQLYASLIGFIIFGVLIVLYKKRGYKGQVFLWFLILHSIARLFLERFRGDHRGLIPGSEMSVTQLVALLILIASIVMIFIFKNKQRKQPAD